MQALTVLLLPTIGAAHGARWGEVTHLPLPWLPNTESLPSSIAPHTSLVNVQPLKSPVVRDPTVNRCKLCLFIQLKQQGHGQHNQRVSWDLLYLHTCKCDIVVESAETEKLLLPNLKKKKKNPTWVATVWKWNRLQISGQKGFNWLNYVKLLFSCWKLLFCITSTKSLELKVKINTYISQLSQELT